MEIIDGVSKFAAMGEKRSAQTQEEETMMSNEAFREQQ